MNIFVIRPILPNTSDLDYWNRELFQELSGGRARFGFSRSGASNLIELQSRVKHVKWARLTAAERECWSYAAFLLDVNPEDYLVYLNLPENGMSAVVQATSGYQFSEIWDPYGKADFRHLVHCRFVGTFENDAPDLPRYLASRLNLQGAWHRIPVEPEFNHFLNRLAQDHDGLVEAPRTEPVRDNTVPLRPAPTHAVTNGRTRLMAIPKQAEVKIEYVCDQHLMDASMEEGYRSALGDVIKMLHGDDKAVQRIISVAGAQGLSIFEAASEQTEFVRKGAKAKEVFEKMAFLAARSTSTPTIITEIPGAAAGRSAAAPLETESVVAEIPTASRVPTKTARASKDKTLFQSPEVVEHVDAPAAMVQPPAAPTKEDFTATVPLDTASLAAQYAEIAKAKSELGVSQVKQARPETFRNAPDMSDTGAGGALKGQKSPDAEKIARTDSYELRPSYAVNPRTEARSEDVKPQTLVLDIIQPDQYVEFDGPDLTGPNREKSAVQAKPAEPVTYDTVFIDDDVKDDEVGQQAPYELIDEEAEVEDAEEIPEDMIEEIEGELELQDPSSEKFTEEDAYKPSPTDVIDFNAADEAVSKPFSETDATGVEEIEVGEFIGGVRRPQFEIDDGGTLEPVTAAVELEPGSDIVEELETALTEEITERMGQLDTEDDLVSEIPDLSEGLLENLTSREDERALAFDLLDNTVSVIDYSSLETEDDDFFDDLLDSTTDPSKAKSDILEEQLSEDLLTTTGESFEIKPPTQASAAAEKARTQKANVKVVLAANKNTIKGDTQFLHDFHQGEDFLLDDPDTERLRQLPRNYLMVRLPVYDMADSSIVGFLRDITEKGLQVAGMNTAKGQAKRLLLQADEFADLTPFSFEAECRWTKPDEQEGILAGFQITKINDESLAYLRRLIGFLSLGTELAASK